ncbi:flagellar basal-body MS-ring/collar protein FliF [uncultured Oxalicibacterium sp.]|uniref:flagellar basal-body MS-ring/collar protein FliF n=1 Tax=uncultured Oxalicibacterium sp. TaxID=1168540 RepID=UPI0025ED39F9|nr:flagellar basal-body MS-ring/collar protein FliF [uncultured Oxalicibacterium sp.]
MAVVVAGENPLTPGTNGEAGVAQKNSLMDMARSTNGRRIVMMIGVAAVIAAMVGIVLWSQKPDYRVLFSNFSDRDGGAIVASLQQANVPYKFAEGGSAILVPADRVHDLRLKLAAEGLPKGGNVGFELMENQKLGISQFLEQVNFQRALEGELARSIQSVGSVQSARVHLAMPKQTVFVRDQQKPTASVLLNLYPGRSLDQQQVSAIVHLVASSVPDLPPKNVTIVDQSGNLLSENNSKPAGANTLDPSQLKYVQELQQSIAKRVESIITPIVGSNNVRAEATADVDFSTSEQAAEIYKPNQGSNSATVRSMQSSESNNGSGNNASGVPGALTNQPAANATAPLNTTPPATPTAPNAQGANGANGATTGTAGAAGATAAATTPTQRDVTTNYEVDKTVRYVQQPMGGVKRLSVAVVVNYKRVVDKDGNVSFQPLSDVEKNQIRDLVKEAMGFNQDRGDTLNVVNSPFAGMNNPDPEPLPLWERPEIIDMAIQAAKYLALAIVLLIMYRKILTPMFKKINPEPQLALPNETDGDAAIRHNRDEVQNLEAEIKPMGVSQHTYQQNLEAAKELARKDPKVVANIVKAWVGNE